MRKRTALIIAATAETAFYAWMGITEIIARNQPIPGALTIAASILLGVGTAMAATEERRMREKRKYSYWNFDGDTNQKICDACGHVKTVYEADNSCEACGAIILGTAQIKMKTEEEKCGRN